MSESGEVDRDVVIAVLRQNGVDVHGQDDGPEDMLVLAKGNKVEGQRLPKMVSRKMLHYLARKYDIYIHHFYHPEVGQPKDVQ
jgi:hypothetical protein